MTITDFRHFDPGSSGRRPLLIALMMYSFGFVGAGLLLWRSGSGCAPQAQCLDAEIVCIMCGPVGAAGRGPGGAKPVDHYLCW
jgi:hypothetical protein